MVETHPRFIVEVILVIFMTQEREWSPALRITVPPSLADLERRQSCNGEHAEQSRASDSEEYHVFEEGSEAVLICRDVVLNYHESHCIAHLN